VLQHRLEGTQIPGAERDTVSQIIAPVILWPQPGWFEATFAGEGIGQQGIRDRIVQKIVLNDNRYGAAHERVSADICMSAPCIMACRYGAWAGCCHGGYRERLSCPDISPARGSPVGW
jgi:hypothetical protein